MATPNLSTLSNRAYDDYVSQCLSRLENQAHIISRRAAEELNRTTGDPYDGYATTPRSYNNRLRRSVSTTSNNAYRRNPHDQESRRARRRPPSDNPRSHQEQCPISFQGYPDQTEESNDHGTPGTPQDQQQHRGRRIRSASMGAHPTRYNDNRDGNRVGNVEEDVDSDDEDHEIRRRAILTRRNTKHNQEIPVQIMDTSLYQSDMEISESIVHNVPFVEPGQRTQQQPQQQVPPLPQLPLGQQQQQQHYHPPVQPQPAVGVMAEHQPVSATPTPELSTGTAASSSTGTGSPLKKKKWPWSLFTGPAAAIASNNKQVQRWVSPIPVATILAPIQSNGVTIWPVNTTGPRGDTLSPIQQDEIVRQLPGNNFVTAQKYNPIDFTKVTELTHIWVFRAAGMEMAHSSGANVWITFDYQNQKLLMQHYYRQTQSMPQPICDDGIEIYDSHIRDGHLPVMVFPSQQLAYYGMTLTGERIVKLQVNCLPNSKGVKFVYRQPQY